MRLPVEQRGGGRDGHAGLFRRRHRRTARRGRGTVKSRCAPGRGPGWPVLLGHLGPGQVRDAGALTRHALVGWNPPAPVEDAAAGASRCARWPPWGPTPTRRPTYRPRSPRGSPPHCTTRARWPPRPGRRPPRGPPADPSRPAAGRLLRTGRRRRLIAVGTPPCCGGRDHTQRPHQRQPDHGGTRRCRCRPPVGGPGQPPAPVRPLSDPKRRAACPRSAIRGPAGAQGRHRCSWPAGRRSVLVLPGDRATDLVALAVAPNCSAVSSALIAQTTVTRP